MNGQETGSIAITPDLSLHKVVGAECRCLDLGDYPLNITNAAVEQLIGVFQDFQPNILLTHTPVDPFNPDHPVASQMAQKARLLSTGAGVASAFSRITPPDLCFFERHRSELCDFKPNVFVDISPVMDMKIKAMDAMKEFGRAIEFTSRSGGGCQADRIPVYQIDAPPGKSSLPVTSQNKYNPLR